MIHVYIILTIVALLTATLSAILGMGGGILLLAAMFSFLDHAEAIPTHAVVQIFSNGTRILVFVRNVVWSALARFAIGVLPGGALGVFLLWKLGEPGESEPYLKMLVGAYILVATYLPKPAKGRRSHSERDFTIMGFVAGTAALTVGAVGPLIAPLFARHEYAKERLIATKATCQMLTHVVKIPAFVFVLGDRIDVPKLAALALAMSIAVIPGTLLGKRVLRHVSVSMFTTMYRVALTIAGTKVLLYDGLANAAGWVGGIS
jgi:uncharacterized membrane protein YfcA